MSDRKWYVLGLVILAAMAIWFEQTLLAAMAIGALLSVGGDWSVAATLAEPIKRVTTLRVVDPDEVDDE